MSLENKLSLHPVEVALPVVSWDPVPRKASIPSSIGVVLGRVGTLDGKNGIVMADEAMAIGIAKGLMKSAEGALDRCDVLQYDQIDPGKYDGLFLMHHTVLQGLPASLSAIPKWLWVHNPGISHPLELRRAAVTAYQRVFHAGRKIADACGFDYLPHGLEDLDMFTPSNEGDLYDVGFVGNAVMHSDLVTTLLRLIQDGKTVEIRGARWKEAGVPSAGSIPMNQAGSILARSSVCLDHVSKYHRDEGMTSTRIYQVLACESALVTTQSPGNVPEELHKHMVFAADAEEAYRIVKKLLADPIARAKLRTGSRRTIVNHTMLQRARTIWARIVSDSN